MNKLLSSFIILALALFTSCEKQTEYSNLIPGFWSLAAIQEDGADVVMSACEQDTRLLAEKNGLYRLYSSCDSIQRYGTWIITNETMLDLSLDYWNGSNKYEPYPVRFSILKLTNTEMEIRIKTFIGERKKIVMFTPLPQDVLAGKTPGELLDLDRYNKTLKTYIYRFVKID